LIIKNNSASYITPRVITGEKGGLFLKIGGHFLNKVNCLLGYFGWGFLFDFDFSFS
jgi:hypothetical protein